MVLIHFFLLHFFLHCFFFFPLSEISFLSFLSLYFNVSVCIVLSLLKKTNKNRTKIEIANEDTVHLNLILNRMAAKKTTKGWGGGTYIHSICIYNLNVWEATTELFMYITVLSPAQPAQSLNAAP